jgi:hypothetical protein
MQTTIRDFCMQAGLFPRNPEADLAGYAGWQTCRRLPVAPRQNYAFSLPTGDYFIGDAQERLAFGYVGTTRLETRDIGSGTPIPR